MKDWDGTIECSIDMEKCQKVLRKSRLIGVGDKLAIAELQKCLDNHEIQDVAEDEYKNLMSMPELMKIKIDGGVYHGGTEKWEDTNISFVVNAISETILNTKDLKLKFNEQTGKMEYLMKDNNQRTQVNGTVWIDKDKLKPGIISLIDKFKNKISIENHIRMETDTGIAVRIDYKAKDKLGIDNDYTKIISEVRRACETDVREISSLLEKWEVCGSGASLVKRLSRSDKLHRDIVIDDDIKIDKVVTLGIKDATGKYMYTKIKKEV